MARRLDKNMYQEARRGEMTLTEFMAKEMPSEIPGLDAFEFALHQRGINLKTATVEQFFRSNEDSVLFPEFINRNVRLGLAEPSIKNLTTKDLIATTTIIDSTIYEAVKAEFDNKSIELKRIAEGAPFPFVEISKASKFIRLSKIGVALKAPYEVLRRMRLPLLASHLKLIGRRLSQMQAAEAVYVLINGDGNENPAVTVPAAMNYSTLVEFLLAMTPWESTVWFAKKALIEELLLLPELRDSGLFDTVSGGGLARLLGNPLKRFTWEDTDLGKDRLFQVDKDAALELTKEAGSELVETDKIIDRQFEATAISLVSGFSKIFAEAAMSYEKQAE